MNDDSPHDFLKASLERQEAMFAGRFGKHGTTTRAAAGCNCLACAATREELR